MTVQLSQTIHIVTDRRTDRQTKESCQQSITLIKLQLLLSLLPVFIQLAYFPELFQVKLSLRNVTELLHRDFLQARCISRVWTNSTKAL